MFQALRKHDVGMIGIKPFASGNLFASRGVRAEGSWCDSG